MLDALDELRGAWSASLGIGLAMADDNSRSRVNKVTSELIRRAYPEKV